MISVLLVDDQELVRTGFRFILDAESDLDVVGEAADGAEAAHLAATLRPDVVLMDVRMPGLDGIEATRAILSAPGGHHPRVVILTTFDLDEHVYAALAAGASGFLLKDVPAAQLADAVRTVHRGEALLAPSVTRRLISAFVTSTPHPAGANRADAIAGLTAREQEVLVMIARGLSNAEIAVALVLSEATVKSHVGRIFAKLGVRDRAQAVIAAYESGLVAAGG